jgi:glycine/D-amino acid oxidase-like deaminating enzyme
VTQAEAERYSQCPVFAYDIENSVLRDLYFVPPVRYPDGRYWIKLGANTDADRFISTFDDVNNWYRDGQSDVVLDPLRDTLLLLVPGLKVVSWKTARCVISSTPHKHPFIDDIIPGRMIAAVGGNGRGVLSSDGIGQLAASIALEKAWPAPVGREKFYLMDQVKPYLP